MAATTHTQHQQPRSSPPAKEEMERNLKLIEEMTSNVDAVQERVLEEILTRNADAEYLATKCGLAGATDRATFRAKVPMVTYEDLRPYIRRIADGDRSPILSGPGHPISELLASSGTSGGGEPKLIPTVEDDLDRRALLHGLVTPVMSRQMPGLDEGSRLYFCFVKSETRTPGGLPARGVMTSFFRSHHFKNLPYDPRRGYTSPAAAVLCEDTSQGMYAQMLCGLCHRGSVRCVGAVFAYSLLLAIRFLQLNWAELAADIEAGALTTRRVTDPSVREAVAGVLRQPDPELARFIRAECSGDRCQDNGSPYSFVSNNRSSTRSRQLYERFTEFHHLPFSLHPTAGVASSSLPPFSFCRICNSKSLL